MASFPGVAAVDLKEIKAIIDLMKKNSLTEFELEQNDVKIKLKRGVAMPVEGDDGYYPPRLPGPAPAALSIAAAPAAPPPANETEIKSPMIGTLYRAPSPDAAS